MKICVVLGCVKTNLWVGKYRPTRFVFQYFLIVIKILDPNTDEYKNRKKSLMKNELILLRELGYCLDVIHPHQYIIQFLINLDALQIANKAWAYLNDSFRNTYLFFVFSLFPSL